MPISHSTRLLTIALAASTGIAVVSCSSQNKSDRSPPTETAASVGAAPSSATPTSDTTSKSDTAPTAQPETSAAQPARAKASTAPVARTRAKAGTSASPKPATPTTAPATDSASAPPPAPSTGQEKWLSYDAATKTVTFELIAGPFTFNGFRNGGGTLVVPPNANVVMNFVNKDGTPHSAIVISGEGPIPNAATDPAIQRAYTNKVLEGLPQEATDVMRFPVPASGTYRIFCGVPGHGLSGMWIWMKIDPAAKAPTFGPTKA
jgi:hypothetical protein